jgi:hypothetical protein
MIEVFPLNDYFLHVSEKLVPVATPLLILFFMMSIGIFALRAFEGMQLESKVFHFVVSAILIGMWPQLLMGLKTLVDGLNTILIQSIFGMDWKDGVGASLSEQLASNFDFGADFWNYHLRVIHFFLMLGVIASRQIIYWLFVVFFFFYAALGPLVIARGVFADELGVFLELIKEITVLLLWQATYVAVVGLVDKSIGSPESFVHSRDSTFLEIGRGLALIVLTLFVPALTRKFASDITAAPVLAGFRGGGIALGLATVVNATKTVSSLARAAIPGASVASAAHGTIGQTIKHRADKFAEFVERSRHHGKLHRAEKEAEQAHEQLEYVLQETHKHEHEAEHIAAEVEHDIHTSHPEAHMHLDESHEHEMHVKIEEEHHAETAHHIAKETEHKHHVEINEEIKKPKQSMLSKFLWGTKILEEESPDKKRIRIRREILSKRGPYDTDKYNDLAALNVNHEEFFSTSMEILEAYARQVDLFHHRFGWLYDYKGNFVGEENQRPISWDHPSGRPPHPSSPEEKK